MTIVDKTDAFIRLQPWFTLWHINCSSEIKQNEMKNNKIEKHNATAIRNKCAQILPVRANGGEYCNNFMIVTFVALGHKPLLYQ